MNKKLINNPQTIKIIGIWFVILTLFICELIGYTWCRIQYLRISYEISQEAEKYNQLIALQNNLKIEISRLVSPDRISKFSSAMGLKTPSPEQVIHLP